MRCSHLNAALGAVRNFLVQISNFFLHLFWFFGNLALSSLVLESLNPQNMSKFAGCLIGFLGRFVVSIFGPNRFKIVCFLNTFIG